MTGQEAIDSFRIYFDRVTSFSAPGYLDDEILLFLNNAQDQFIKDKVFGQNFQPPAFEDNQKRVVDIRLLLKKAVMSSSTLSAASDYGTSAYRYTKSTIYGGRILYTVGLEVELTRTNPVMTNDYIKCEPIKDTQAGKFIHSAINRTHFLYPKLLEDSDYYYIICDYYTSALANARMTGILKPYPITVLTNEYTGVYNSAAMNLDPSVHQEIVDIAVQNALQSLGDPRWQTKVSQSNQIETN